MSHSNPQTQIQNLIAKLKEQGPAPSLETENYNPGQVVPGLGGFRPKVLLVGEAPGACEQQEGKPFVGRAGRLLQNILLDLDWNIEDLWVTNVVKHRPPNNRNPSDEEINWYLPYFIEETQTLAPKAIVCLGRIPTRALYLADELLTKTRTQFPTGSLRGKSFCFSWAPWCLTTWHPAYILRNPSKKPELIKDLKTAAARVNL